jgi:hypothetical protein
VRYQKLASKKGIYHFPDFGNMALTAKNAKEEIAKNTKKEG